MSPHSLYANAFIDQSTGLPNALYFGLIREWEERRTRRRKGRVCVLTVRFHGGDPRLRRSLSWRLRREFRENDLVAADGPCTYHILLASPDAEHAADVLRRLRVLADELNARYADAEPLTIQVMLEHGGAPDEREGRDDEHAPGGP